jgi:hypothetical protein
MIHNMRKIYNNIGLMVDKIVPIALIALSIYIYIEISNENKRLKERIETLTSLVSYKTTQIIEQIGDTTKSKK